MYVVNSTCSKIGLYDAEKNMFVWRIFASEERIWECTEDQFLRYPWDTIVAGIAKYVINPQAQFHGQNYVRTISQRKLESFESLIKRLESAEKYFGVRALGDSELRLAFLKNIHHPIATVLLQSIGESNLVSLPEDEFLVRAREIAKSMPFCFKCGSYNHTSSRCTSTNLPVLPYYLKGLTCGRCNKKGHLSFSCTNGYKQKSNVSSNNFPPSSPSSTSSSSSFSQSQNTNQRGRGRGGGNQSQGGRGRGNGERSAGRAMATEHSDQEETQDPPQATEDISEEESDGAFFTQHADYSDDDIFPQGGDYYGFDWEESAAFMQALTIPNDFGDCLTYPNLLPPKSFENSLAMSDEVDFVGLKDGPKSRAYAADTHCPVFINDVECVAAYDSQSTISCADPSVFEALGIKAEEGPLRLKGVNSMQSGLYFAWVKMSLNRFTIRTKLLCHNLGEGRILMGHKDGKNLGVTLQMPTVFPCAVETRPDVDWVRMMPGENKEVRIPEKYAQELEEAIEDCLKKHDELKDSVTVNDPDSVYHLHLKDGVLPWFAKQYPIPVKWYRLVDEMIKLWARKGWIIRAPDDCPYNNPILPRPKISGGKLIEGVIRLCLDAQWLNENTEGGFTNIPDQEAIYAALGEFDMLSEIDIDNGYNRIPLGKESQPFTAFTQPSNGYHWMFTVLIYGIKGAGGFFQRAILRALSDLCDDTKVYIDNVFVHTKTPPDSPWDVKLMKHKEAVCQALNSLHQDNWKVKRAKCNFGYRSLRVLGSLVTGSKRSVDPEKKVDLSKKGRPKTKKQLISLVAFINYLRDYIPAYDRVIGRLYKLQGKKNISEKDWKEAEGDEVLKDVLEALNQGYVLHQPDPTLGPFYIDTDASQFGVGAALYQKTEDDKVRFIGFTSKKFNDAQKSYPAGKRELLALINALNRWRHIVHGYPVIAVVDHKSLTYMKNSVSYMILDWLNFLQRFDLRVVHRPGLKHILPDSLSHLYEMASTTEKEEQEEADTPHVSAKEIPKYPKPPSDLSEPDIELSN